MEVNVYKIEPGARLHAANFKGEILNGAIEVQRPSSSKADELTKLSRLKTEGLISESEIESLKKEIIG